MVGRFRAMSIRCEFSAVDLLRLNQQDLVRLCRGEAEGLRMFNALHAKLLLATIIRPNCSCLGRV
jgi:hypothetical protein